MAVTSRSHLDPSALRGMATGSPSKSALEHSRRCRACRSEAAALRELLEQARGANRVCPDALLLSRHADGDLRGIEASSVLAHVLLCGTCASDVERLAAASALEAPAPRRTARPRTSRFIERVRELVSFELPVHVPVLARGASSRNDAFERAMSSYRRGQVATARRGLAAATRTKQTIPEASLYLGACLLHAGEPEKAVQSLQRGTKARRVVAPEWRWLLAQALLAAGRADEALSELDGLARGRSPWRTKARQQAEAVRAAART